MRGEPVESKLERDLKVWKYPTLQNFADLAASFRTGTLRQNDLLCPNCAIEIFPVDFKIKMLLGFKNSTYIFGLYGGFCFIVGVPRPRLFW